MKSSEQTKLQEYIGRSNFHKFFSSMAQLLIGAIIWGFVMMVNSVGPINGFALILPFMSICCILIGAHSMFIYLQRRNDYTLHPAYKKILALDESKKIIDRMELELQDEKQISKFTNCILTHNFLFRNEKKFDFLSPEADWMPVSQVVWAYANKIDHYVNFFPTGTEWRVKIILSTRQIFEVRTTSEREVSDILNQIHVRVPYAFFGYNKDMENNWYKDPDALAKAVEERKSNNIKVA